jgi:hypothetical protein
MKSGERFQYPSELAGILHGESPVVEGQPMIVARDLQQIYMHRQVSNEAVQMHLDYQHPLAGPIAAEGTGYWPRFPRLGSERVSGGTQRYPPVCLLQSGQPPAEKQELMRREREKYKLTVIDPDFFSGATNP